MYFICVLVSLFVHSFRALRCEWYSVWNVMDGQPSNRTHRFRSVQMRKNHRIPFENILIMIEAENAQTNFRYIRYKYIDANRSPDGQQFGIDSAVFWHTYDVRKQRQKITLLFPINIHMLFRTTSMLYVCIECDDQWIDDCNIISDLMRGRTKKQQYSDDFLLMIANETHASVSIHQIYINCKQITMRTNQANILLLFILFLLPFFTPRLERIPHFAKYQNEKSTKQQIVHLKSRLQCFSRRTTYVGKKRTCIPFDAIEWVIDKKFQRTTFNTYIEIWSIYSCFSVHRHIQTHSEKTNERTKGERGGMKWIKSNMNKIKSLLWYSSFM